MGTPVPASDLPDNKAVPAADMPDGMTNVRANREPTGLKEPDEWMPYLFNAIKKVPGDIASMLDVPEMEPYATMGKIAHKLTGTVPPKHKSAKETIDTAMGAKDLPTPRDATGKPDFRPEILANVLEYGGAGVLTGGGIGAAEKAGAGMLKSALTGAVKGGTAGASSGAWTYEGKQIGEMIGGEKGGNIGETVAAFVMPQVTGGASGFAMKQARKGYAKAAEKVPFLMSEEAKKTAAAESASKEMTDALRAHTDTEKNMARSKEVEAQIPGMETTIGRRTGAPGAIAAENYVNERSPEAMAKAQAAEAKTRSAIESKKAELYPEGDKTTTGILQANNEANVNRMQRNLNRYDRMLERQAENLQRTDTAEAGANIRQLYDERMKAAKNTVGAKYGLAYATAETNKVRPSIEGVYKTAEEVDKAAANKFQKEPGVIGDIIRAYKGESVKPVEKKLGPGRMTLRGEKPEIKKDVSFEEFHSLYKRANEEYYKALLSTDPAAPNMARLIGKVRDQLHGEITKYEGTEYGDLAKHFKEANRAYAEDYLQPFKKGVGGEIGAKNKLGPSTENSLIVSKLVLPGADNVEGMQQYLSMAGNNPNAIPALRTAIKDMFVKSAAPDGVIDPNKAKTFFNNHHKALSVVPQIEAELKEMTQSNSKIQEHRAVQANELQSNDKTALAKLAGHEDHDLIIKDALKSTASMKSLIGSAKSEEDKSAVVRSILDHVSKQADPRAYADKNIDKIKTMFDSLGKNHWNNFNTLVDAYQMLGRVKAPTTITMRKIEDPVKEATGTGIPRFLSVVMSMARHYLRPEVAGGVIATSYFAKLSDANKLKALEAAVYDPTLADRLIEQAKHPSIKRTQALQERLNLYRIFPAMTVTQGKAQERADNRKVVMPPQAPHYLPEPKEAP